ncbi:hypothetical protein Nepgr_006368 [Nepenthes gracilis]|uniref:Uncharacterized protein n=1 Tax=Nepenthes gracilis TaxID=150966 RepID=A0AAD3XHB2_NEPGR|nr:hypothetical protein Nepgr_006368 [Nepenthes gracilis]
MERGKTGVMGREKEASLHQTECANPTVLDNIDSSDNDLDDPEDEDDAPLFSDRFEVLASVEDVEQVPSENGDSDSDIEERSDVNEPVKTGSSVRYPNYGPSFRSTNSRTTEIANNKLILQ